MSRDRDHRALLQLNKPSLFCVHSCSCSQPCPIFRNNSATNWLPSSETPSISACRGGGDLPSNSWARSFIFPLLIVACTPTGKLQSPCNRLRNSRSARRQSNVSRSLTDSRNAFVL